MASTIEDMYQHLEKRERSRAMVEILSYFGLAFLCVGLISIALEGMEKNAILPNISVATLSSVMNISIVLFMTLGVAVCALTFATHYFHRKLLVFIMEEHRLSGHDLIQLLSKINKYPANPGDNDYPIHTAIAKVSEDKNIGLDESTLDALRELSKGTTGIHEAVNDFMKRRDVSL